MSWENVDGEDVYIEDEFDRADQEWKDRDEETVGLTTEDVAA